MRKKRNANRVLVRNRAGKDHWEDLDVNCKAISKFISRKEVVGGGVEWINLAHDSDEWWAFVFKVMNLRVI